MFMYHIRRCRGAKRLCTWTGTRNGNSARLRPCLRGCPVPAYLEVGDYHDAEHIIRQMEKHLHAHKKKDFTPEESEELRRHYAEWFRGKSAIETSFFVCLI